MRGSIVAFLRLLWMKRTDYLFLMTLSLLSFVLAYGVNLFRVIIEWLAGFL